MSRERLELTWYLDVMKGIKMIKLIWRRFYASVVKKIMLEAVFMIAAPTLFLLHIWFISHEISQSFRRDENYYIYYFFIWTTLAIIFTSWRGINRLFNILAAFDKADTISVQIVGGSDTIEKPYSFHCRDFRIRTIYCFLYGSYMCINASTNAFVQKH